VAEPQAQDLRRKMATGILAPGFPWETVDAALGSREGRLARTYEVHDPMKGRTTVLRAWECVPPRHGREEERKPAGSRGTF